MEGSAWPLTWTLCDNAEMTDLGDGDYQWSGNFWAPAAGGSFEWKFVHNCTTYESLPQNRVHTIAANGSDTDVHFVRSTDDGASWSTPVRVNDGDAVEPGTIVEINTQPPPQ